MILSLVGVNSYMLNKRLAELVSEFTAQNGELALERIDGTEVDPQSIVDAVQSLPMLAEYKMVIVRELSQNKAATERIEQIISSTADTTHLIFYEPEIDRRSHFFKVLKEQTQLNEFKNINADELANWLVDEAKKQSAALSSADANYLVQRIGENQQMLASELDKLITYAPEINRDNIDLLVEQSPQSRVFDLLDAAFSGDRSKVSRLFDEQRAQNEEPQKILAMVTWQLWLMALVLNGQGKNNAQIAKEAGMSSTYPLDKARRLVAKIGPMRLKRLVDRAYEIDNLAKKRPIDLDEALKTYLILITV